MIKELQAIGLGRNESKVYEALVRFGPVKAGELIVKLDMHRNLVYQSLDSLVHKGFATKVMKKGVAVYQISDPESLLTSIRRKEEIFKDVLSEIKSYHNHAAQQITVYEGVESYRNFWISSIERSPVGTVDNVAGAGLPDWYKVMGKTAMKRYYKLAKEKKFSWRQLYFSFDEAEAGHLEESPVPAEVRYLKTPHPVAQIGGSNFNVIHDAVILHTMNVEEKFYRVIEIRDAELVKLFQTYFEIMWEKAEEVRI